MYTRGATVNPELILVLAIILGIVAVVLIVMSLKPELR